MRPSIAITGFILFLLTGCVQNKYNWNGYDLEKEKQIVPPGLYAELGTLYLQEGDAEKAKKYYAKERDAWPESKTLMDTLIKNLDSRKKVLEKSKT